MTVYKIFVRFSNKNFLSFNIKLKYFKWNLFEKNFFLHLLLSIVWIKINFQKKKQNEKLQKWWKDWGKIIGFENNLSVITFWSFSYQNENIIKEVYCFQIMRKKKIENTWINENIFSNFLLIEIPFI